MFKCKETWIDRDYDFVYDCKPSKEKRGNETFHRPGNDTFKLGLNVSTRYGGDKWLSEDGAESWPVSYHGTSIECVGKIVDGGYTSGDRDLSGVGVYSAPTMATAARYCTKFQIDGKDYCAILMNRVNPKTRQTVRGNPSYDIDGEVEDTYYVSQTAYKGEHTHEIGRAHV